LIEISSNEEELEPKKEKSELDKEEITFVEH